MSCVTSTITSPLFKQKSCYVQLQKLQHFRFVGAFIKRARELIFNYRNLQNSLQIYRMKLYENYRNLA